MTAHPVKYFEHYFDGGRSLAVHRLDELVQVTFTHGPTDLSPTVVFFAPTSAHALVEAIDAAAREAQAIFDAAQAAQAARRPVPEGLPAWGAPFTFGGLPYTECPAGDGQVGDGQVGAGQSARPETATGRIWHDDCAEDAAAHRQSLTCPDPLSVASAPSGERSAVASSGGADGAAGGSTAAMPGRPAAPIATPA